MKREGALIAPLHHLSIVNHKLFSSTCSQPSVSVSELPRLSPGAVAFLQPLVQSPRQPRPQLLPQPHSPGPMLVSQTVDQPMTQTTQMKSKIVGVSPGAQPLSQKGRKGRKGGTKDLHCCAYNGIHTRCKSCVCVKSQRTCSNCLPTRCGGCCNSVTCTLAQSSPKPSQIMAKGRTLPVTSCK